MIDILDDVKLAWNMLYIGLLVEADKFCPYKNLRVKKNRPIWYNGMLCNLERERDMLLRNFRRSGSTNEDFFLEMLNKRKEFNRAVKEAKSKFYNQQIYQSRIDPKTFWKLMEELLGKRSGQNIDRVYMPGTDVLCDEDHL